MGWGIFPVWRLTDAVLQLVFIDAKNPLKRKKLERATSPEMMDERW
jgi:hypothetical protein